MPLILVRGSKGIFGKIGLGAGQKPDEAGRVPFDLHRIVPLAHSALPGTGPLHCGCVLGWDEHSVARSRSKRVLELRRGHQIDFSFGHLYCESMNLEIGSCSSSGTASGHRVGLNVERELPFPAQHVYRSAQSTRSRAQRTIRD